MRFLSIIPFRSLHHLSLVPTIPMYIFLLSIIQVTLIILILTAFFPTPLNFVFTSSEQFASDIIHFLVQASPHTLPNNLQLVVFENMLIKHYKQSLISHINLLLLAFPNSNYTTFETIICSCIAHI